MSGILHTIGRVAVEEDIQVFAVGGFVRDLILDRQTSDIDFVTIGEGTGIRLASAAGKRTGGSTLHVYENFGTAALRVPVGSGSEKNPGVHWTVLEFVASRRESYRRSSRKPLVEEATQLEDLERRDFTVNAIAMDIHPERFGTLIDPLGGIQDIVERVLRTPLDPDRTFEDDPLRMIRAARFATQLDFVIHGDATSAMTRHAERLDIVSKERITDELQKIMLADRPSVGLGILEETGLLIRFLPELSALRGVETVDGHRHKDNFYHTLQVVDNLVELLGDRDPESSLWLRWAALLHDIGKPRTKRFVRGTGWTFHAHEEFGARMVRRVFDRLRLPTDHRLAVVEKLVRMHHRPVALVDDIVTDSAVRRLIFDAGDDVEDLMTLVRADITSRNPTRVRRYLRAFDRVDEKIIEVEEKDRVRNFQPPVDGVEIMRVLGIRPGLAVGILRDAILDAILNGDIPNEHDPALEYMLARKDDAIRRGRLFDLVRQRLASEKKRVHGAIKNAVATGVLPQDDEEAVLWLSSVQEDDAREDDPPTGQAD